MWIFVLRQCNMNRDITECRLVTNSLPGVVPLGLSVFVSPCSRSGSTWQDFCVLWAVCASSSAAPQAHPHTVHLWVPWPSVNTPWSLWALVRCPTSWPPLALRPRVRHLWAASWTGCWLCWFVATTGWASMFAPMLRISLDWSSVQLCIPCCSTSSRTALASSLTLRVRWVRIKEK